MGRRLSVQVGMRIGKLVVTDGRNGVKVACKCDCGIVHYVRPRHLRFGEVHCCPHCRPKTTAHGWIRGKLQEGDWVGALKAVAMVGKDKRGRARWRFECICGGSRTAIATEVKRERNPTCGTCKQEYCVIVKPYSHKGFEKDFKHDYNWCKDNGYKMYDASTIPPRLVYEPEKG